jgi:hypothetical protein
MIRPNDKVWSFDVVREEWRLCRVAKPYSIPYKGTLVLVTIAGETTEATYQHPYWVVRGEGLADRPWPEQRAEVPRGATMQGRWVDSCDLRVGDELLLRDGRIVPIERLTHRLFEGAVYNMAVEDLCCYSVGRNSVLVHNDNGPGTGDLLAALQARNAARRGLNAARTGLRIDCEIATAQLRGLFPGGTPRRWAGDNLLHEAYEYQGRMFDVAAGQYVRPGVWTAEALEAAGLTKAVESGVFSLEQHATFMQVVCSALGGVLD